MGRYNSHFYQLGIAALGLTSFVLPSIERRFSLSSKELGIIASANDISALLLVVFISFYGDYGNKIKWIGGGAVFVGEMNNRISINCKTLKSEGSWCSVKYLCWTMFVMSV